MMKEISTGTVRWYPYLAQEFRSLKKFEAAINYCHLYVILENSEDQHLKVALDEVLFIFDLSEKEDKWVLFQGWLESITYEYPEIQDKSVICEYLAMTYYYLDKKDKAKTWHQKAVRLSDESQEQKFITNNDKFYS